MEELAFFLERNKNKNFFSCGFSPTVSQWDISRLDWCIHIYSLLCYSSIGSNKFSKELHWMTTVLSFVFFYQQIQSIFVNLQMVKSKTRWGEHQSFDLQRFMPQSTQIIREKRIFIIIFILFLTKYARNLSGGGSTRF